MTDVRFWDQQRGIIRTSKGGMAIGRDVYAHGYSLLRDLAGRTSFFQVLVLNVTGRLPEKALADWLEGLFICMSYPDARIWCNQIGALAGSLRCSPVAGVCAGIMASDSHLYGPGTQNMGVSFIEEAVRRQAEGWSVQCIIEGFMAEHQQTSPKIPGYVRPLIHGDERIPVMLRISRELGFTPGPHLQLALKIDRQMASRYDEGINLLGLTTAFLCDQGFSACQQYRLLATLVMSGVHACYAEAADRPPETFLPLRCEDIDYQGVPQRPVPTGND